MRGRQILWRNEGGAAHPSLEGLVSRRLLLLRVHHAGCRAAGCREARESAKSGGCATSNRPGVRVFSNCSVLTFSGALARAVVNGKCPCNVMKKVYVKLELAPARQCTRAAIAGGLGSMLHQLLERWGLDKDLDEPIERVGAFGKRRTRCPDRPCSRRRLTVPCNETPPNAATQTAAVCIKPSTPLLAALAMLLLDFFIAYGPFGGLSLRVFNQDEPGTPAARRFLSQACPQRGFGVTGPCRAAPLVLLLLFCGVTRRHLLLCLRC